MKVKDAQRYVEVHDSHGNESKLVAYARMPGDVLVILTEHEGGEIPGMTKVQIQRRLTTFVRGQSRTGVIVDTKMRKPKR